MKGLKKPTSAAAMASSQSNSTNISLADDFRGAKDLNGKFFDDVFTNKKLTVG